MAAPVGCSADPWALRQGLSRFDFAAPQPLEAVLAWTIEQLESGIVQITHPRYFGLFNPQPSFPAELADRIAAAFNPQLASATTSPFPVALEAHVIAQVGLRAGFRGPLGGHFTSGGSEANRTALICALTSAHAAYAEHGVRAFAGQPTFYVSAEAHLAWVKIAVETGLGRPAARLVPTDGAGRLAVDALTPMIQADRQSGAVPVMLVATAGTTGGGAIDPLTPCAEIAAREGLWLHVDAAWGGAAIASPRLAMLLAGIERARSLTIDAHKWFATTMGCGMFLTAHPEALAAAFAVRTSFMPPAGVACDPYVASSQWSRRFLGLRLFLAMACAGWEGFAAHVERASDQARYLAEALRARGWQVLNDPSLAVVCAVPPAGRADPATVTARVVGSGVAWVSTAVFAGQSVVRACITNGETSRRDLDLLTAALEAASQGVEIAAG